MNAKPAVAVEDDVQELVYGGSARDNDEIAEPVVLGAQASNEIEIEDGLYEDDGGVAVENFDEDHRDARDEFFDETEELNDDRWQLSTVKEEIPEGTYLVLGESPEDMPPPPEKVPSDHAVEDVDFQGAKEGIFLSHEIVGYPVAVPDPVPQLLVEGLPDGFSVRLGGIYVVLETKDGDEYLEEEFLCSSLRGIDRFLQRNASGWGRRIAVTDPEGHETLITVLDQDLKFSGKRILSGFVDLGLCFGRVKRAREIVLDLIRNWNPDKLLLSTYRQGWADSSCEAFVLPGGRIVGNDVVSLNTESSVVADSACDRGTLEDWRANVAAYCAGNTLMMTVVSLAFVGPLLEVLVRNGGGLHLRGRSSKGKTTLQQAAASVWGPPEVVQSWRTTDNALEIAAVSANSMLLVLDELGEIGGQAPWI